MARVGIYSAPDPGGIDVPLEVTLEASRDIGNPAVGSGQLTAAAAAAVVADTGALAAGTYRVEISMGLSGALAAGKHMVAEHRNAANGANIHTLGLCPAGAVVVFVVARVVIAANERVRVVMGAVAGAVGEVSAATVRAYLLAV